MTPNRPSSTDESDEALFRRYYDRQDVEAFEALIHRYEKPIYNYLLGYVHNRDLAEEVFQTTFVHVHEKRRTFTPGRRFRPWLYSIATHAAIDALRREGRRQAASLDERRTAEGEDAGALIDLLESSVPSPLAQLETEERSVWAQQAVERLPEHLKVVVLLIFFQGLSYREAAEALDIPLGTVKSRMNKALLKLNQEWHAGSKG